MVGDRSEVVGLFFYINKYSRLQLFVTKALDLEFLR